MSLVVSKSNSDKNKAFSKETLIVFYQNVIIHSYNALECISKFRMNLMASDSKMIFF